jgi:predicted SprT family Zn-dependent metalloprotease
MDDASYLLSKLQDAFDRLNNDCFGGVLPKHTFRISRYAARTHGRINLGKRQIMISLNLFLQHGWEAVEKTLLHEMTHAYLHLNAIKPSHGKRFWDEFIRRGGVRDKIEVKPLYAYIYVCRSCGKQYPRMRKIRRPWLRSCPKCDIKYNPKHALVLKSKTYTLDSR